MARVREEPVEGGGRFESLRSPYQGREHPLMGVGENPHCQNKSMFLVEGASFPALSMACAEESVSKSHHECDLVAVLTYKRNHDPWSEFLVICVLRSRM